MQDPEIRAHKLLLVVCFAILGGRFCSPSAGDALDRGEPVEVDLLVWHKPSRAMLLALVLQLLDGSEQTEQRVLRRLGEMEDDDEHQLEGQLTALAGV